MSTKTQTIAKSLHTITALARVATHLRDSDISLYEACQADPAHYVGRALAVLGYDASALDPYGLAAKAALAMA
tara:strand:+ start:316 stop:534 length:219 start_codon:yes stop_codon:yes gene_type:complete